MKYGMGLFIGAFLLSGSLALMGVIYFAIRDNHCPSDCRSVPRNSGTGCNYRECYCKDVDPVCQPKKLSLTTVQRRTMRLLYAFALVGGTIVLYYSCCLCARAEGPTQHVNYEDFPSIDSRVNFPQTKTRAYDYYVPQMEMSRLY